MGKTGYFPFTKTTIMDNSNTNPAREQVPASHSSHPPPTSFQGNTLLLVAALLIVIGFFLPWIGTGGSRGRDYDEDFGMPAVNGTFLISTVGKIPEIGWLLTVYLILVPLGGIIVAYNASQKWFSEKMMMFGIASAVFIPLSLFTLYLSVPKGEFYAEDFLSGAFKLGIGFIMMIIGGIYCLIYAIGRISKNMKNISSPPIFKFGVLGGVLTGGLIYLFLDNINGSTSSVVYIYLAIVIAGILLSCYFYRTSTVQANYHSGLVTGFVFAAAYVFTLLIIASITNGEGTGQFGRVLIFMLVFQALFGFVFTSLMSYNNISTTGTGYAQPQMPAANTTESTTSTNTAMVSQSQPVIEQPKVVQPAFDWGAYFNRNKKTILGITFVLIAGIAAWIILKPNPERSGRKAGKAYCNCGAENSKGTTKAYEDFIKGFDSAHYQTRSEARGKLQESLMKLQNDYTTCSSKASGKYADLRKKFRNDYRKLARFESAYYKASSSCKNDTTSMVGLFNKVEEKVKTIKEPEPGIDKIKADIINQSIPGWTFSYLTEIKQATITNTARTDERIEYTVDLKLENYSTKEEHDAQIIIAYNQGADGWYQSSMNEVFITYNNMAPVGEWKSVTPLSNCSYSIIHEGRKFWVQDGSYGSKYKGGGDDAEDFYLSSTQIYIMSRESEPVKLVFRYTPNAQ